MDRRKSKARKKLSHGESQREKIRDGEDQRGRQSEERRCRCAKRCASREKTVFFIVFFNVFWLRGSKSRLAKAAGAEPAGQMRDEKLHALVARSTIWK